MCDLKTIEICPQKIYEFRADDSLTNLLKSLLVNQEWTSSVTKEEVISAANKGKVPWNKGKKIGPNHKLREHLKNRELTEDQVNRMREGAKKGGATNKGRKRPDLAERNRTRDKSECQRGPDGKFKKKS